MLSVLIPILVLLILILVKKIPVIKGNITIALVITGILTLLLGKVYNIESWVHAWITGLDKLSWIIALSIVGSIFAEISLRMGTIDTIMAIFLTKFKTHPRLLMVSILFTLTLAGSLLGDAIAAATVIGMLTISLFISMDLAAEKICSVIVMGACIGSIMPPMTQALFLSSSLVNANTDQVVKYGYVTVSVIFILVALYCCFFLLKKENIPGANKNITIVNKGNSIRDILKSDWRSLIPLLFLIVLILLRTLKIPHLSLDFGPIVLKNITLNKDGSISLYSVLSNFKILKGFSNGIVLSIIASIIVATAFPVINKNMGNIFKEAMSKVKVTVMLQICCAFMIGCFYQAGAIDKVISFATGLNNNLLIIGGAVAMIILGMLTGSQSTTQNVVFSFLGPALVAAGFNTTFVAIAGAHLANAGQGLPPADLTTFVVAGIVGSQYGKKVDPLKSMFYSMPMCILFAIVGLIFLYI